MPSSRAGHQASARLPEVQSQTRSRSALVVAGRYQTTGWAVARALRKTMTPTSGTRTAPALRESVPMMKHSFLVNTQRSLGCWFWRWTRSSSSSWPIFAFDRQREPSPLDTLFPAAADAAAAAAPIGSLEHNCAAVSSQMIYVYCIMPAPSLAPLDSALERVWFTPLALPSPRGSRMHL